MVISKVLDTRRANRKGLFPVKIRVSYSSKADMFPTSHFMNQETFNNILINTTTPATSIIRDELCLLESRIREIVFKLPVYSKENVLVLLAAKSVEDDTPRVNDVLAWFKYKAKDCIDVKDSRGTAESYNSSATFYKKYFNVEAIPFEMITPAKLYQIQRELVVDYSPSTIGKYARHLRSIYNLAIAKDFISKSLYPFGMHKYVPPTSRKRKHALSRDALQALLEYKAQTDVEQYHLDMFFFSFFGNGLNMKDVATIRYRDMSKYHIIKKREKTINANQEPIRIHLMPQLLDIIERQGNKDTSPDNYIFPLLDKSWNSERCFTELKSLRGKLTRTLTRIGNSLGIEGNIPHGTSRHCFANALKQSGASAELISETIGHSSVAVTKHYTSDFEESGISYQSYLLDYTRKK